MPYIIFDQMDYKENKNSNSATDDLGFYSSWESKFPN